MGQRLHFRHLNRLRRKAQVGFNERLESRLLLSADPFQGQLIERFASDAVMLHEITPRFPVNLNAPPAKPSAATAFDIILKKGPTLLANPAASAAFDEAAAFFESLFTDPITVVIDADLAPYGNDILGQTSSVDFYFDEYTELRNLIAADAAADEFIATQLPTAAQITFLLPNTPANPYSIAGTSATRANLLALGESPAALNDGPASAFDASVKRDMSITFSSQFPFDFTRADGITENQYDFVGVAIHEIAHGFGFVSEVNTVDYLSVHTGLPRSLYPTALDLFRLEPGKGQTQFSTTRRIMTTGEEAPIQVFYDGGIFDPAGVPLAGLTLGDIPMSTGELRGDERTANHWKDDQITGSSNIGLMDPMPGSDAVLAWKAPDMRALTLIGWDRLAVVPEIEVRGNGILISDGDSTPSGLDSTNFGATNPTGGLVVRTFTIRNVGSASLTLTGNPIVSLSGTNAADFTVNALPDSTISPAGGFTTFQITFDPAAAGVSNATVNVQNNSLDKNPYDFSVQGTAAVTWPEMDVLGNNVVISNGDTTPTDADQTNFGIVGTELATKALTFTIRNSGTATLNLTGSPRIALTGPEAADFSVTSTPASNVTANGGTRTFQITFDPSAEGLRRATVSISNNDADENPYQFSIQGTGAFLLPDIEVLGNDALIFDGDIIPTTGDFTNFGDRDTAAGSVSRTFTIRNSGPGTLQLTGSPKVGIVGPDAASFSVASSPSSLISANGGTTTFRIAFDPSTAGIKTATVIITSTDIDENPYDFAISGTGTQQPEIEVRGNNVIITDGDAAPAAADFTDFGATDISGSPLAHTFVIRNTGSAPLLLNGNPIVQITGPGAPEFQLVTAPVSPVAAGNGSTSFQIAFDASVIGQSQATVSIMNDDADESSYDFAIQGIGATAFAEMDVLGNGFVIADGDTSASAADLTDFGSIDLFNGTITRTFTIRNNGLVPLELTGNPKITITGPNAPDFVVSTTPISPVAPIGTTTFQITFDPAELGPRQAFISIVSTDADENPYDFTIRGTATNSTGITITPRTGMITNESGSTTSFTIVLDRAPAADVSIAFSSSDTTEGTVSPSSIVFATANWNQPRFVTITSVDDSDIDGDVAYSIVTALAVSADPSFSGQNARDLTVVNVDNDALSQSYSPLLPPLRANTFTTNEQLRPSVAIDKAGGVVIVWDSYEQDGQYTGVYGQRISANGTLVNSEFRINTTTLEGQDNPDIAMDSAGNFVVVWTGEVPNTVTEVFAQRFNANGNRLGGEFRVNTFLPDFQYYPKIGMAPDGRFVVAWMSYLQDGSQNGIYAQRFSAAGVKQGAEFRVNTTTLGDQFLRDVALNPNGEFIIVWDSVALGSAKWEVYAQRFDANGGRLGGPLQFRVHQNTDLSQFEGTVGFDSGGSFVIAWARAGLNEGPDEVMARQFASDGSPITGDFNVSTNTSYGHNQQPKISVLSSGDFTITWNTATGGAFAQQFAADGTRRGGVFRPGGQQFAYGVDSIAANDSGGLIFGLSRYNGAPQNTDAYAALFGPDVPPTTTGLPNVAVHLSAPDNSIDLYAAFQDDRDADSQLTYTLIENSYPSLFTNAYIDATTGKLILDFSSQSVGSGQLKVRATDSAGGSVVAAFAVTILPIINGVDGPDVILFRELSGQIHAFVNVPFDGKPTVQLFVSLLPGLTVNSLAGDDTIVIDSQLSLPLILNAGAGLDTLLVNALSYSLSADLASYSIENLGVSSAAGLNIAVAQHLASLTLTDTSTVVLLQGGNAPLILDNLTLAQTAKLELTDNSLILHTTPVTKNQQLTTLTNLLAQSRNSNPAAPWTGPGLTSSSSAANPLTTLAVLLNDHGDGTPFYTEFANQPVGINDILIKYTYNGDTDLNGIIDCDDYFRIDKGFASTSDPDAIITYHTGDFDYSQTIDADDYFRIDTAYVQQSGPLAGDKPVLFAAKSRTAPPYLAASHRPRKQALHHRLS